MKAMKVKKKADKWENAWSICDSFFHNIVEHTNHVCGRFEWRLLDSVEILLDEVHERLDILIKFETEDMMSFE